MQTQIIRRQPTILFDARLVLDKPTGIGQYVSQLLPELFQLAPDWHFHLLRQPNPWPGYNMTDWALPNLTHHVSRVPTMSLRQHLYLPWLAHRLGANLLHYPHFDAPVFFRSVPIVATIYDTKYLLRPDFFTNLNRLKSTYMRLCYTHTLRRAEALIAVSYNTAHDLHQLFTFPLSRLQITLLAADARFQPATAAEIENVQSKYNLKRPFILSVGELRPHKNQVGLLHAYASSNSCSTHDLIFVGQTYRDFNEPQTTAKALHLSDQVHFLTDVSFDDLVSLYTAAAVFVLMSFHEGFGLPILEAMACGAPVIASRTTATGEVTGDGGVLVEPEDTGAVAALIDHILTHPHYRQELIAKGRQRCAEFAWKKTASETLSMYQRVLGET